MIHDKGSCDINQLCYWDEIQILCVESDKEHMETIDLDKVSCKSPKVIKSNGIEAASHSQCMLYVTQPAIVLDIDSESQAMFYHWWASWSSIVDFWKRSLESRRDVHFFITKINDPMFFQYFGFLSDFSWRRTTLQVPPNVCFCNAQKFSSKQARIKPVESAEVMMNFLDLQNQKPPSNKASVGIISRRRKRFILNEYELVDEVIKLGYECQLLPLESMTLYEQMKALRSIDVLIGVHGSALDNSVFLNKGSVMVQLLPYAVDHKITFESSGIFINNLSMNLSINLLIYLFIYESIYLTSY
jgi:hypothetical protein